MLYWKQDPSAVTALKVKNAPPETELGIISGDEFVHIFQYPAVYDIVPVEIKRVTHRQALDGALITTEPKYLYRFDITWTVCPVSEVVGGIITEMNDFEFLLYLENNKHLFSNYGTAEILMQLNYIGSFPSDTAIEEGSYFTEQVFPVNMINLIFMDSIGHELMEVRAIFETTQTYDKLFYTLDRNRE